MSVIINTQSLQILQKTGFLHIKNFFNINDIIAIRDAIDKMYATLEDQTHSYYSKSELHGATGLISEINHVTKINPKLKESTIYQLCRHLITSIYKSKVYKTYDHSIYKTPNSGSVLWHQDQAYKHSIKKMDNIMCWIPLHDINKEKGCMRYVSQTNISDLIPHTTNMENATLEARLPQNVTYTTCEAKAGDLILHLPLTLHSSLPNKSNEIRKAWILHFGPYGRLEPFKLSNLAHLSKHIASTYFKLK